MEDARTVEYFDRNLYEYSLERMRHVVAVLVRDGKPGDTLVDIGCGTGNAIEMLRRETPLTGFAGIDPSANYARIARERTGCPVYVGSVLDRDFLATVPEKYDYALLASVLHHLVGRTRRESGKLAERAIGNALMLLKPGGTLFVVEAAFSPAFLIDLLFHVKRIVSRFTDERMELGASWYNIGPPVVSYYTNERLAAMVRALEGAEPAETDIMRKRVRGFPMNLLARSNTTLVVKKKPVQPSFRPDPAGPDFDPAGRGNRLP